MVSYSTRRRGGPRAKLGQARLGTADRVQILLRTAPTGRHRTAGRAGEDEGGQGVAVAVLGVLAERLGLVRCGVDDPDDVGVKTVTLPVGTSATVEELALVCAG